MSATASPNVDAANLLKLARTAKPADRGTLYENIAALVQSSGAKLNSQERLLLMEIMSRLTHQVEMSLRLRLAESLADEPAANHDLILLLVNDEIEVATPLILRSEALTDSDLIGLIDIGNEPHQVTVAQRERISSPISRHLFERGSENVWCALAKNETAVIDSATLNDLAEKSQHLETLCALMVRRPDLPTALAEDMYVWVSGALKAHLVEKFGLDESRLAKKLNASVEAERSSSEPLDPSVAQFAKLVNKLHDTGQLKPTYLIKALREGQIPMFELAFAKLLDVDLSDIQDIITDANLERLALAIRAAGIDRSAFGTIAVALRGKSALMDAGAEEKAQVHNALRVSNPEEARKRLFERT